MMPTKRQVLEHLKRDELLAAADAYELTVNDRRQRALLVDALAGSRKARLDDVLAELPRDRLKELCRDFGLDDSGRAKAPIVARLAGSSPASGDGHEERPPAATREPDPLATAEVVAHEAHDAAEQNRLTQGKLTREQLV